MSKELKQMAFWVKVALWLNLIVGTLILSVGAFCHEWPVIANGSVFVAFAAFVCPWMLRVISGKS
jgi:hypothetical protein